MSDVKFKLNRAGVAELMKSAPMQNVLSQYASDIQARCGDGYVKDIHIGKNRANAMVSAKTYKARKDNMKNNTLLKAVN